MSKIPDSIGGAAFINNEGVVQLKPWATHYRNEIGDVYPEIIVCKHCGGFDQHKQGCVVSEDDGNAPPH